MLECKHDAVGQDDAVRAVLQRGGGECGRKVREQLKAALRGMQPSMTQSTVW